LGGSHGTEDETACTQQDGRKGAAGQDRHQDETQDGGQEEAKKIGAEASAYRSNTSGTESRLRALMPIALHIDRMLEATTPLMSAWTAIRQSR
jgi:hypothetical protein